MQNYQLFKFKLKQRIAEGKVTQEDLEVLAKGAKAANAIQDRVLFAQASAAFKAQEETKQEEARQVVKTLEKAEEGTESVEEMRALLRKVEEMTAGKDDEASAKLLSDTRKRYQVTRIMHDLPLEESETETEQTD